MVNRKKRLSYFWPHRIQIHSGITLVFRKKGILLLYVTTEKANITVQIGKIQTIDSDLCRGRAQQADASVKRKLHNVTANRHN